MYYLVVFASGSFSLPRDITIINKEGALINLTKTVSVASTFSHITFKYDKWIGQPLSRSFSADQVVNVVYLLDPLYTYTVWLNFNVNYNCV